MVGGHAAFKCVNPVGESECGQVFVWNVARGLQNLITDLLPFRRRGESEPGTQDLFNSIVASGSAEQEVDRR